MSPDSGWPSGHGAAPLDSEPGEYSNVGSPRRDIPLSSPDITELEIDAVTRVLRTPHLSLGPELQAFESALAAYHVVPHAVAVSSGTAALHLALVTLGIGEGDEVIVPSFAFIAVANAVLQVHATPVFAEIDAVTLNLDPAAVEQVITSRTRALIVVHTFGVPADMDALQSVARRYNLFILEDACEAIGAEYGGLQKAPQTTSRKAGSFGHLAVLGFYPNKQITTGEGGAILVHNPAHANRLRSLRNQGRSDTAGPQTNWLNHVEIGFNYRLAEIACALGRTQLSRIDEILTLRSAAAARYNALLIDASNSSLPSAHSAMLELPPLTLPERSISWFVYVVRLPRHVDRDRVHARLAAQGIATGRYFAPIHLQPAWRSHPSSRAATLPVTESIAARTLALPFFNRITPPQQERVTIALKQVIADES